jgi:hypothetical protein
MPDTYHTAGSCEDRHLNDDHQGGSLDAAEPIEGVEMQIGSPEMRFAAPAQINDLAAEVPQRYRALVLLAGYCGLRRHRVDLAAGTVAVVEQITEIDARTRLR